MYLVNGGTLHNLQRITWATRTWIRS
jgi:hypothetical protein